MKKIILLFFVSLAIISCEEEKSKSVDDVIATEDLSTIRAKKSELSSRQSELATEIDKLEDAIKRLDTTRQLTLVRVDTIKGQQFRHFAEVQGDVATDENIIIYPEFSGLLTRVYVEEGDRVRKGQTLATIDDGGLRSQLAQLEAQAALAKTTFERQERLWKQNIGSEIQYLEAKTNYESMQSSVNQLKSQLSKTVVTAPFTGTIDEVISEQGEVVNPGQSQLFRLVSLDDMYVEAAVPENYLGKVKKGTTVKVQISSVNKEFNGEVSQVSNNINPNNRSFMVKVKIPNGDGLIKPNQIATLKLNDYTSENAIVIPESSIQKNALGESLVYIFEPGDSNKQGTAKKSVIETGYVYNDSIEVTSGLKNNEILITEGSKSLREGQEVQINNEPGNE
ncbi:efflux RND transporter periplasmic adaptor subunit [Gramella sp. KN1008]|uniref:efflux RND transporter periplasmic adaptor subunit n=1 Tax=Gramella sp. KN1008 TaxID=2529298 RepID=UPI00103E94AF|nr:efflux RND transporter periplasmic adaptor subunit [Gramella sp. KN1008]TBW27915.1 efflux RND transporter periplasmic adaptor subunit [Gramella sp. KN1008]